MVYIELYNEFTFSIMGFQIMYDCSTLFFGVERTPYGETTIVYVGY